jgi:hypothetical protein
MNATFGKTVGKNAFDALSLDIEVGEYHVIQFLVGCAEKSIGHPCLLEVIN